MAVTPVQEHPVQSAKWKEEGEKVSAKRKAIYGNSTSWLPLQAGNGAGSYIRGEEINANVQAGHAGKWQVGLSFGHLPSGYDAGFWYFTTQPIAGQQAFLHQFQDGSTTDLFREDVIAYRRREGLNISRLSLFRALGGGFRLKASLLLSLNRTSTPRSVLRQIPNRPDVVYYSSSSRDNFWVGELGIQYVFLRNRRFQPFLGIDLFQSFYANSRTESTVNWPGQNISETAFTSSSSSQSLSPLGYFVELGGMYYLDDHYSIGPNFSFVGIPYTEIMPAFGLEVRYRW